MLRATAGDWCSLCERKGRKTRLVRIGWCRAKREVEALACPRCDSTKEDGLLERFGD